MKKILIISPHYPPSNLAAVHRTRLFVQHLESFGWKPIVLTVHERYYEETLDWNLHRLLPLNSDVRKCGAFKVTKPRLIGDIGLRAFFHLFRKAKRIIRQEKVDFLYIPIPSFYTALLGRFLHAKTGIKYGIDYIDPWVHEFPGLKNTFSRHWWSTKLARLLEPIAVKNASLVTGVAEGYYEGVRQRNPHLAKTCVFGAMPYGGEKKDHEKVKQLALAPYLFPVKGNKIQLVYAGAMLPKAYSVLEAIFRSIISNKSFFSKVEFHFIGTGKTPNDNNGFNIKPIAQKYGLWQTVVFEYPARIPYLDVLAHLEAANGVFVLGSSEPHYTPSKMYQGILSGKPVFAVLHRKSSAVNMLKESNAGIVLDFNGENEIAKVEQWLVQSFEEYLVFSRSYTSQYVNAAAFDHYSAAAVTQRLVEMLDCIIR